MHKVTSILLSGLTLWAICEARGIDRAPSSNSIQARISGGNEVTWGVIPYQVSIQNIFGEHVCAGSIIAPLWILTAGHCMDWPKKYLKIVTGTVQWENPGATYLVDDIKVHCLYTGPVHPNDIALVRLATPIVYDSYTAPVQLATSNTLKNNEYLLLTGWGSKKAGGNVVSTLNEVYVKYLDHATCRKSVRNSYANFLGVGHICTSTKRGKGACHLDSGGPLVDADDVQVGVVNGGEPCALGYPDIFASVAYFHEWINQTMEGWSMC